MERVGTGEHVVLVLHGWFGSSGAWAALTPHLDTERFSYVFPDFRGYGGRRGEAGSHTIAEMAADVLLLADELGADRFSLVGHSMGGSVMQYVLAEAPERVRALFGVSPVPASGFPMDEQTWQLFSSAAGDAGSRRAIIDFTTGGRHPDAWLDGLVQHSLNNSDTDAFGAYLEAWSRTDFSERIAGSEVPIKVVVGEHDPALNEDVILATFGEAYPKLEVEVLPDAGHYAADEVPVTLANMIEVFLDEH